MSNDPITVAASRDGHEYHEAWASRVALGLLMPGSDLHAIAMEGFAKEESEDFSSEAMDIADMVQYFGGHPSKDAKKVIVTQFKYVASENATALSAGHISKTISKFLEARRDYLTQNGAGWVEAALEFEFATNREVGGNLRTAIRAISEKKPYSSLNGMQKRQYRTLTEGEETASTELVELLSKLSIVGAGRSLRGEKASVRNIVANWGGANDVIAKFRFHSLCQLLRDKAGTEGYKDNVVKRTDVLGALELSDEDDLFPVPQSFPDVENVVARSFLDTVVADLLDVQSPMLIHGAGGSGKTVTLQALAQHFGENCLCILHDGFGGGRWRMPGDERHLVSRSLVHLVNSIAVKGLCDPLLPGADEASLLRTGLKRLKQATAAFQRRSNTAKIVLLLDAVDHAGLRAEATNTNSFANQLIEALLIEPIDGLLLVASCRTERIADAVGDLDLPKFEIPPFDDQEVKKRADHFDAHISDNDVHVLKAKSLGNPRYLDALLNAGRPYDGADVKDEGKNAGELLDELIQKQFEDAKKLSVERGVSREKTNMLLRGMSVMPPPIPVAEIADAYSLKEAEIVSFFSDLFPLIEITDHGLIFRDEPTETVARRNLEADAKAFDGVIANMKARQAVSTYATRSLPHVLQELNLTDELVELAFSTIIPSSVTSKIARTGIHLARISKAVEACAAKQRSDDVFRLSMFAASIAGGSDRSDALIESHPELVAASNDPEALRRLVENKSQWPGAHHGTLAATYAFLGDFNEAKRQALKSIEWLNWYNSKNDEDSAIAAGFKSSDWKSPLYVLLLDGQVKKIVDWLSKRSANKAFRFFASLLEMLQKQLDISDRAVGIRDELLGFLLDGTLKQSWCLSAALTELELEGSIRIALLKVLAQNDETDETDTRNRWEDRKRLTLKDAYLDFATESLLLGLKHEAKLFLVRASIDRPERWDYENQHDYGGDIVRWVLASSIECSLGNRKASVREAIPAELWKEIPTSTKRRGPKAIEEACKRLLATPRGRSKKSTKLDTDKIERCLEHRSKPLVQVIQNLQKLLTGQCDARLVQDCLTSLAEDVEKKSNYPFRDQKRYTAYQSFMPICRLVSLAKGWDEKTAKQVADWIPESPLGYPREMYLVVRDLAKTSVSNEAAICLAAKVFEKLKQDDQIGSRLDGICRLGEAVWGASRDEAGAYFKEALNFADAVGSDNHDEINWLASIAAAYGGPPINEKAVHDFNRICEIGLPYEEEKFIWPTFSQGLARIGGFRSVSFLTRLADRGKADLRRSFLPYLQELIVSGRLTHTLAASLLGLDQLTERWDWNAGGFVGEVLDRLPKNEMEQFARWVVQEFDRVYAGGVPQDSLKDVVVGFSKLPPDNCSRKRVEAAFDLASKRYKKEYGDLRVSEEQDRPRSASFEVDRFDVNKVDEYLQEVTSKKGDYQNAQSALLSLSKGVKRLDERIKFLNVIQNSEVAELREKLAAFEAVSGDFGNSSLVIQDFYKQLPIALAKSHADELWGGAWFTDTVFRELILRSKGQEAETLCCALLASRSDLTSFSACDWLRYAYWFSKKVTHSTFEDAFSQVVSGLAETIPEGLTDPEFSEEYSLEEDQESIVAQLLWFRLGAPDARDRWRAAHSMVRLARMGSFDVLGQIMGQFDREDAVPFNDVELPFYHLHAKLWMMVAFSKIAYEMPGALKGLQSFFVDAIQSQTDHALIRHYAFSVLNAIPKHALDAPVSKVLSSIAQKMKAQGIVSKDQLDHRRDHYGGRPDGKYRSDAGFYFDHDFDKNTLNGVGELFHIDTWRVEEEVAAQVRQWNSDIKYMRECPRNLSGGDWNGGDRFTDGYGAYLAHHAVWVSVGKYFKTHKLAEHYWRDDPWEGWIADYLPAIDGQAWLADAMDLFPIDQRNIDLKIDEPNEQTKSYERRVIASITGAEQGRLEPDQLYVNGFWQDDNGNDVKIASGFVRPEDTVAVVESLLLTDPFFQWLPDEDDHPTSGSEAVPVEPWLFTEEIHREGIDASDPYAVKHVAGRTRPNDKTIAALSLKRTDDFGRSWMDESQNVFLRSEAWGLRKGQGQHETETVGDRLAVDTDKLKKFLRSRHRNLIILIKIQKYIKSGEYDGKFATKTAAVIVSGVGSIKVPMRISAKSRSAIAALSEHDRSDFPKCYEAVLRCR
ncbi:hypothetical protein [Phaeobacter sp. 11ANDIMAR09]|uniref:hypothetical protein n=1 Tax=Phaeobacter sp. 11ANDIMAR09 TaxID=1225647 RepID=UPI000A712AAB|nr:hypothetical protein [Phaeobacter sp. 11ANDIMAR09]